MRSMK